ncbi:MAG: hypothetical protein NTW01_19065 [Gammaproteobacteria bacterium]|nr:hypothetical protein [Gammaproteobacteria bacterium]
MSRTLYEFQLPALVDAAALRRLRGELDMRTALSIRYHDLNLRIVRVIGRTGREDELRALFASLGFPPASDDPTLECQHRPLRNRRRREPFARGPGRSAAAVAGVQAARVAAMALPQASKQARQAG